LFKPSIWLEEVIPVPKPRIFPSEDNPVLASGTLPRKDGLVLTSKVNLGASAGPIEPNLEPEGEIVAIVWPPDPEVDS
jgi:hypothetical protein